MELKASPRYSIFQESDQIHICVGRTDDAEEAVKRRKELDAERPGVNVYIVDSEERRKVTA